MVSGPYEASRDVIVGGGMSRLPSACARDYNGVSLCSAFCSQSFSLGGALPCGAVQEPVARFCCVMPFDRDFSSMVTLLCILTLLPAVGFLLLLLRVCSCASLFTMWGCARDRIGFMLCIAF
ncbi:hypothetical protein COP1_001398 [Malus domestica]